MNKSFIFLSFFFITNCGGGGSSSPVLNDATGSADTAGNESSLFTGTWDITGNWDGESGDEAYFVIREIDPSGTATTVLYDYDGDNIGLGDNCYEPFPGEMRLDPGSNTATHRGEPFFNALLSLAPDQNSLTFRFTDTLDIDNDGNSQEQSTYTGRRTTISESNFSSLICN